MLLENTLEFQDYVTEDHVKGLYMTDYRDNYIEEKNLIWLYEKISQDYSNSLGVQNMRLEE